MSVSLGVNVTSYSVVLLSAAAGAIVFVVHAKVPSTEAAPPESVLSASVCPYVIAEAVGAVVIVGVALLTVRVTLHVAVL